MKLPVLICEKLFQSLDLDNNNFLSSVEFIDGLSNLYTGSYEETAKIIFNLFDVDKTSKITPDNIKILLSFLPLKTDKTITEYTYQMNSLNEIDEIISITFGNKKELTYEEYIDVIEKKKSDSFLQLLCFLYQRKPFNEDIIKLYKVTNSPIKANTQFISPQNNIKRKYLASPSRKSILSPVESFLFNELNLEGASEVNVGNNKDLLPSNLKTSMNNPEVSGLKGMKRMPNKIVEQQGAFDSPSNFFKKASKAIPEFSLESNFISMDIENTQKINGGEMNNTFEDYIYKLSEGGKLKKYYLVLSGSDIIYYKDNKKEEALGLHNLSGTFIKEGGETKITEKTLYTFSIVFSQKERTYYVADKKTCKEWTNILKKAIGYDNFFDHYEMLDEIGEGKFGLVKLGVHFKTKEKVAIKIINKATMEIADLELVKSEIDIMKLCRHPNVVRLLDHFENSEYIFLVMEYLSGGDLGNYLTKKKFKFTEQEAANIMVQIANGLNYLHKYGVLHRDLKPDNIMIANTEDVNPNIKIMDFGLSKVLTPHEKVSDGFGTLSFVAPEVLTRSPYNKQIDVWSMGIILFYMLTGELPFDDPDDNEEKIAKMIVFNDVNFPDKLFKTKTKELVDIINKCLIKNPEKRITVDQYIQHAWIKKFCS
jgi:Ca2+-binding EF-hand superfamily protein